MVDFPRRTRHNEVVTLGSENEDQGSQRLGQAASSSAERAAWEALKGFVDPPLGSHSGLPVGRDKVSFALPPLKSTVLLRDEVGPAAFSLVGTENVGTEVVVRSLDVVHIDEPAVAGVGTQPGVSASPHQPVGTHAGFSTGQTPSNTPLPVKPVWPESIPATADAGRKKRRWWPILGLVGLLIAGAAVALAKPSVLPASVRKTLHVGSSTDRTEAANTSKKTSKKTGKKTKGNEDTSGLAVSTSTAPSTRPKRAVQGYDQTMRVALTSIDRYWAKQFPEVYDDTYKKLSGGVYAYSAGSRIPTCDGQSLPYLILQQNAFYCPESDFIAWDDQGLFPRLEKKYGRFLLAIVLAHEWGHAIQERSGSYLDTITAEQQADCFAGAWAASIDPNTDKELAKLRDTELDKALSGFIEFRDLVGMVATDPGAHGTAFDRIRAFQDGYEGTPSSCAYYEEELPDLVAIPYRSFKERFRSGNLPYPEVLPSITKELANNWKSVFSTAPVTTSAAKEFPVCFAQPISPEGFNDATFSYCDDDKTLRYDEKTMRTLYDRIGDFGPATTIGVGWAMSDLVAQGQDPTTKAFWNEANCRVGAWAGTMFDADDPENSQLSPGDLDESVRTILESSAKGASKTYGTGFEQVSAFRAGVLNGVSDCNYLTP